MCRWVVWVFAVLYIMALALFVIGTWGLFGQERDPLSGIFLVPLGLPWTVLLVDMPERILPWLGALAPVINLVILVWICRRWTVLRKTKPRKK